MKKLKIVLLGLALFSVLFTTGCKKEGCTDPIANNYCDNCKDGGTCEYSADFAVWWGQQFSQNAQDLGATGIVVYIEDKLVDSKTASTYWSKGPDNCDQLSNYIYKNIDLGTSKTKKVPVKVEFELADGSTVTENYTFDLNLNDNQCYSFEIKL